MFTTVTMVFEIAGKVACVTGGASGLGHRFSQELLKNGVKVSIKFLFDTKKYLSFLNMIHKFNYIIPKEYNTHFSNDSIKGQLHGLK